MATTTRRSKDGGMGKEKVRGTNSHNDDDNNNKEKSSATTDQKHIPNYLRSTISSRVNEPAANSKLGKKNNNSSHPHQDNKLMRRRSFDKPPSASPRGQKALISPGPRDRAGSAPAPLVPRERKITVRSSSFGKNTVTATRNTPVSKTPTTKAAASASASLRSPKPTSKRKNTATCLVNKKETSSSSNHASGSRKSSSSSSNSTPLMDHEANNNNQQENDHEVEVGNLDREVEVVNDNSYKVESETSSSLLFSDLNNVVDHHVLVESEAEDQDQKIITDSWDISTCTSEDQNAMMTSQESHNNIDDHDEEDKLHDDDGDEDEVILKGDHEVIKETETGSEEIKEEEDEVIKDKQGEGDIPHNKMIVNERCTDQDDDNDDNINIKEVAEEEANNNIANVALVLSKVQLAKKESPSAVAYNDVIEETASKLLEKRKNKVKALVGAFETVIDYQSAASSSPNKM